MTYLSRSGLSMLTIVHLAMCLLCACAHTKTQLENWLLSTIVHLAGGYGTPPFEGFATAASPKTQQEPSL